MKITIREVAKRDLMLVLQLFHDVLIILDTFMKRQNKSY